ncbi:MAG TPA: ABC transporter permease [Clostridia bacterium]|nr:ABC transporter permease [Clostridia bacterium]
MRDYIVKRLFQGLLVVLAVSILIFALMQIMPGDPIDLMTDSKVSEERKDQMRQKWGLDKPVYVQYFVWLTNILQGDFGTSIKSKQDVGDMLEQRIPMTLKLIGTATLIRFVLSVPLGLLSAFKKDKLIDQLLMLFAAVTNAIPAFCGGILMILLFGVKLKWLPLSGYETPRHFIIPIAALVLSSMAEMMRLTKTEVLDVYKEKYVQTAYAKGLRAGAVRTRHVLRNAMIPIVVMLFLTIPWIIGGGVIIENIFVIPGMGNLLYQGIVDQDFPVVQACILIIAILTVLCNLFGDIVTAMLDPRIKVEMSGGKA